MTQPPGGQDVKACCAAAYSSDAVALLLGDSYHPGGTRLTRRLADALALPPGERVLDVACGRGTTALLLASAYDARVEGVDYSAVSTALAREAARAAGLAGKARFTTADAEQLPCPDGAFGAVLCECALCTFPDKAKAAAEFARVLRPGGQLGLADVTADPGRLPPELAGLGARIACIADGRPLDEYARILAAAGLRVLVAERHDAAMVRMIDQIEARLNLLQMTVPERLAAIGIEPGAAPRVFGAARTAVSAGALGYALLIAVREPLLSGSAPWASPASRWTVCHVSGGSTAEAAAGSYWTEQRNRELSEPDGNVDVMRRRGTMSVVTLAEAWPAAGRPFTVADLDRIPDHRPGPPGRRTAPLNRDTGLAVHHSRVKGKTVCRDKGGHGIREDKDHGDSGA